LRGSRGEPLTILTVVGARPQFIKAAAVSGPLRERHREVLLHTGQHYDEVLSDRFFRELTLPAPDIELGVGSGTHAEQTARMLVGVEQAIRSLGPDLVLVYGDTNSTLAGALAASKLQVPVAHVEAGLRSYNRRMPEEINRVVTDHLSAWLFCPGEAAARNLEREGITRGVSVVGDVMADVLARFDGSAGAEAVLARYGVPSGGYLLVTVHRAENTDDEGRLSGILDALDRLGEPVVFPAHPRVREAMGRLGRVPAPHVQVIEPVGYAEIVALERHARAVVTDSGGMQKEAYWLGVPCVTLRDETEWGETVAHGWNVLAGADPDRIVDAVRAVSRPAGRPPLYGGGHAGQAIADALSEVPV
jgi:UDP-GlcNAc3NAcA epimerase